MPPNLVQITLNQLEGQEQKHDQKQQQNDYRVQRKLQLQQLNDQAEHGTDAAVVHFAAAGVCHRFAPDGNCRSLSACTAKTKAAKAKMTTMGAAGRRMNIFLSCLKCTSQLVSTRPGINGTDPVEKECKPNTKQCISAKCSFADQSHVIATGCKESPKGSCKDAQLECEKADGKLEQCKCEPGEECKNDKGHGNDDEL
ncbi:hypothetical protein niasHT_012630 [Heterodera trifolii]|uniref:Uncharacterized protein n=1 Tax=Heterodera trifolii TaxID=157864 RepID=A0ABD2L1Q1_9BILA